MFIPVSIDHCQWNITLLFWAYSIYNKNVIHVINSKYFKPCMNTGKVNEHFDSHACTCMILTQFYTIAIALYYSIIVYLILIALWLYIMDDLYIPFLLLLRMASVTIKIKQRAMAITAAIASTAYMARIAIASVPFRVPAC